MTGRLHHSQKQRSESKSTLLKGNPPHQILKNSYPTPPSSNLHKTLNSKEERNISVFTHHDKSSDRECQQLERITWTGHNSDEAAGGNRELFKWLDFKITNRCNNRCRYCGVEHDSVEAQELLPVRVIQEAIRQALSLGFSHFAFLGGEPSIRQDVEKVFLPFVDGEMPHEIMVVTNGLIYNESMYRSVFNTNARRARIIFSLDSLKSPNYKNQNPEACVESVKRIGRLARQFSNERRVREVSIHTVISRENYKDFVNLVRKFHGLGIDVSLALVCPSEFIQEGTAEDFNEFTYDELASIEDQLRSLEEEGLLNFANRTLLEYLQTYPHGTLYMSDSCKAGTQHVIINPDGEVYPCITESYRKGLQFGNIQEESFSDIYRRMADFSCTSEFSSSCWDHFMWGRMGEKLDGGIE